MSIYYHSFLQLLFLSIIALFPVINPIGSAFIINPFFSNLSKTEKRKAVKKIVFYSFFLCTISLFAGHWILELFGLSIPIVQLAGGIMICKMGWEFLSSDKESEQDETITKGNDGELYLLSLQKKLFYPITFPITTGAGTISVLFTLSAHSASASMSSYLINTGAILVAIIFMCILIYIFYLNTKTLINYLGSNGEKIINRITAFLIFCVGLQIAVSGISKLIKIYY